MEKRPKLREAVKDHKSIEHYATIGSKEKI